MKHSLPKYTFSEHFAELKKCLTIVLIWFIGVSIISYYFSEDIFQFLLKPLISTSTQGGRKLIYTDLTEAFFTYLSLSAFSGFILSLPIIAFQIYGFIKAGLYDTERNKAKIILALSPLLFIIGGLFVFYFVIPRAWDFFVSFEVRDGITPIILEAKISEYLSLIIKLVMAFGLAFQMPIILIILSLLRIISSEMLKRKRRLSIVINFIIAGIITPPDVLSQISLAIPMVLLYEFSIIMVDYFRREKC